MRIRPEPSKDSDVAHLLEYFRITVMARYIGTATTARRPV